MIPKKDATKTGSSRFNVGVSFERYSVQRRLMFYCQRGIFRAFDVSSRGHFILALLLQNVS
jgi:hypothetical protein